MSREEDAKGGRDSQRARLSASLRENLKRRKSQQRLRTQAEHVIAVDEAPAVFEPKR
jgi:hypothetical protein